MTDQKTDKEDVSVAGSEGVDAQQPEPPSTLLSQINWRRLNEGEPLHSISEYPLYSDSRFTDEYVNSPGPYSILNPVPLSQVGTVACSMVLRVRRHWKQGDVQYMAPEKDVSRYHGGTLKDEIAALISLILGTRVLAGEESRRFEIQGDGDEYGTPISWDETPVPIIQARTHRLVLPSVRSRPRLDALALLETIPSIPETRFPDLIRACRFYQDALWAAEAEPNLSWLMLVSALEIAASDAASALEDAVNTLKSAKPELCEELAKHGGTELVEYVAKEFEGTFKITNRFIKRTLELLPDPPRAIA
jgi:hypothetical protein